MVARNYGPTWAEQTRRYAQNSVRPIKATVLRERPMAILISTGTRTAWLPKSQVTHDPEKHLFMVPSWLCQKKLLD